MIFGDGASNRGLVIRRHCLILPLDATDDTSSPLFKLQVAAPASNLQTALFEGPANISGTHKTSVSSKPGRQTRAFTA